jgi:WD40 repeat protein
VGPNWKPLGLLYGVVAGLVSMSFLPDGQILAVAYASPQYYERNYIDFWASASWIVNTSMDTEKLQEVAFSPDGRFFAATPDRFAIQVWDLVEKKLLYRIPTSFTGAVNVFAFSPDGAFLASGHYDGMLRIWDMNTGDMLLEFDTGAVVQSLAYSPDGQMISSGGSFENSNIQIWSSGSGLLLRSLENTSQGVSSLVFSSDQRYLVSGSYDGIVRVWGIRP